MDPGRTRDRSAPRDSQHSVGYSREGYNGRSDREGGYSVHNNAREAEPKSRYGDLRYEDDHGAQRAVHSRDPRGAFDDRGVGSRGSFDTKVMDVPRGDDRSRYADSGRAGYAVSRQAEWSDRRGGAVSEPPRYSQDPQYRDRTGLNSESESDRARAGWDRREVTGAGGYGERDADRSASHTQDQYRYAPEPGKYTSTPGYRDTPGYGATGGASGYRAEDKYRDDLGYGKEPPRYPPDDSRYSRFSPGYGKEDPHKGGRGGISYPGGDSRYSKADPSYGKEQPSSAYAKDYSVHGRADPKYADEARYRGEPPYAQTQTQTHRGGPTAYGGGISYHKDDPRGRVEEPLYGKQEPRGHGYASDPGYKDDPKYREAPGYRGEERRFGDDPGYKGGYNGKGGYKEDPGYGGGRLAGGYGGSSDAYVHDPARGMLLCFLWCICMSMCMCMHV
jgi:hypothetical protein